MKNRKKKHLILNLMSVLFTKNNVGKRAEINNAIPIFLHVEKFAVFFHSSIIRMLRCRLVMSYNDYTINFNNVFSDYVLSIVDHKNKWVYTTIILVGAKTCELPSILKGEYTIKMISSTFIFTGQVKL